MTSLCKHNTERIFCVQCARYFTPVERALHDAYRCGLADGTATTWQAAINTVEAIRIGYSGDASRLLNDVIVELRLLGSGK